MVTKIAHLCLSSRNLAASINFYCTVLGIPKKFDFVKNGTSIGVYLEVSPGNYIEFFEDTKHVPAKGTLSHLCLEVDDIDAIIAQVKRHSWPIGEKSIGPDNTWQVWIKDPDGVDIEFHQYTPESTQLTGKDCPVTW